MILWLLKVCYDFIAIFPPKVKCEQYWGSGTKHYEDITVTTTSEIALEDWTIRDFDVKNVSVKMVDLKRKPFRAKITYFNLL